MRRKCLTLLLLLSALLLDPVCAATRVLVTVVERKSGSPVTGLKAEDFMVLDDKTPWQVESAEYINAVLDVVLLLDTSLGVRPRNIRRNWVLVECRSKS